jgi:hypothetical protein
MQKPFCQWRHFLENKHYDQYFTLSIIDRVLMHLHLFLNTEVSHKSNTQALICNLHVFLLLFSIKLLLQRSVHLHANNQVFSCLNTKQYSAHISTCDTNTQWIGGSRSRCCWQSPQARTIERNKELSKDKCCMFLPWERSENPISRKTKS